MSKARRGSPLKREGMNKGTCPITGRTGVKLLYEYTNEAGEKIKISKSAHAKFQNVKKLEARKAKKVQNIEPPAEKKEVVSEETQA